MKYSEVDEEQNPDSMQVETISAFLLGVVFFHPNAEGRRQSYGDRTTRGQMLLQKREDNHFPENMKPQFAFYGKKSKPR